MGDWDADPQREAYQRAIGDYIEFAKIVQHYDKTAYPPHDDIDFEAGDLSHLDGEELDLDGNPVIQCAIFFIAYDDDEDVWEDQEIHEQTERLLFFDDYDNQDRWRNQCQRRRKEDDE